jgi:hypothetical protein
MPDITAPLGLIVLTSMLLWTLRDGKGAETRNGTPGCSLDGVTS